ncbi:MAG: PD-(D/E)XK nuclease family protein [Flavobacteriales bacterium]|nr:PD-(D/E)XK nuclease family protein [Flavobacteriales bacterium]
MNPTFLEKTAQHLIDNYSDNLSELCIVLPNKRAGLFLKQHLSKLIDKPIWLPAIIGTEELIEQLSDVEVIDNVTQLFELYAVYRESTKEPETFDEFSKWGQILLHDFNEIDRYLVPTEGFFKHINEARALEVWNLGEREITEFQSQYLKFWEQLGDLYNRFTSYLIDNKLAYQGLAYRIVAEELKENPEKFIEDKIGWDKVIFVGFNALNKAEEVLISELKKQQKCDILFDADEYYLSDKMQESGLFLRRLKKKDVFQPFNWITNKFKEEQKQINIYGIPQNIGQAKYITNILNSIDDSKNYTDTAVVLADENLLIPVLQSVPETIANINVTMGYPLKNTPTNNFFEIYFNTLVNAERFGNKDSLTYHHKDLLKLFQLPFSQIVFGKENCQKIKQHIVKHNWVFINKEKIAWINDILSIQFLLSYSVESTLKQCLKYIEIVKQHYISNKTETGRATIELEYLFQYAKLFNQMITLTTKYPYLENSKGFYSLYKQILSSFSIELYGEPLKGLQVLGMLETRNIDFKNVILLSTNEGTLPAGKTFNSFIPFDIKKDDTYNLPTHIEKDAVYAYHFYRLLQNAENISILYNTETNEFGSGEQSRFVTQIEHELSQFENITITKQLVTYPPLNKKLVEVEVQKIPAIVAKIKERFANGISPSALITYINCPLDFYYKYVLGVREADEVEETIDHSTFGTYVHDSLEKLYKEFVGKNITVEDLKLMLKKVNQVVVAVFSENFSDKELKSGKNLLTLNIAQNYITTFIKSEIQFVGNLEHPLFINSLEEELKSEIEVGGATIKLKGKTDRIDSFGNQLRVIDYKTGLVKASELQLKHIDDLLDAKKSKAFQLMMYALMYSKSHAITNTEVTSGIISFRTLSSGYMAFGMNKSQVINDEVLDEFEVLLIKLIKEILDVNASFKHKTDAKWCEFCRRFHCAGNHLQGNCTDGQRCRCP